jgi:hypothetical protein
MAAAPSTSEPAETPLDRLEEGLRQALRGRPRQLGWGDPEAMRQTLAAVRERFGSRQAMAREQRIVRGVLAFRILGRQLDFVRLKYVCHGVAQAMDWESRRLLDNPEQVQALLEAVAGLRRERRRFIACCRGLHASWQQASAPDFPLSDQGRRGLEMLQRFLVSARPALPAELHLPEA